MRDSAEKYDLCKTQLTDKLQETYEESFSFFNLSMLILVTYSMIHPIHSPCYFLLFSRTRLEFPPMNSYQRLIIHRVAAYFKLSHVVDPSGKAVVLYKSAETQM